MSRFNVNFDVEEAKEIMTILDRISTPIPPVCPTNDEANKLNNLGIKIASAMIYKT